MTKEEYLSVPFRKDYKELRITTTTDVYKSFIHKRPFKGCRDDYGDKKYDEMRIDPSDEKIVQNIMKKTPRLGYWYKKRKPSK